MSSVGIVCHRAACSVQKFSFFFGKTSTRKEGISRRNMEENRKPSFQYTTCLFSPSSRLPLFAPFVEACFCVNASTVLFRHCSDRRRLCSRACEYWPLYSIFDENILPQFPFSFSVLHLFFCSSARRENRFSVFCCDGVALLRYYCFCDGSLFLLNTYFYMSILNDFCSLWSMKQIFLRF